MRLYKLVSMVICVHVNLLNSGKITCPKQYCANQTITCSPDADCVVNCIDTASCAFTQIHGPINNTLTINCRGNSSCFDISLYCPLSTNCLIKGNDNLRGEIQIYSINGWQNVDIQSERTFAYSPGSMHCGSNYSSHCIIQNDWSCRDNQCSPPQLLQPEPTNVVHGLSQLFVILCGAAGIVITACCVCGVFSVYNMLIIVKKNKKNKGKRNMNASVAPDSQIADSGKLPVSLELPLSPQVDMTVTVATTMSYNCDPSDPKKQHSRYATAIYSGSPLNTNVVHPKSATEIEIDTDWYMQQISEVAEQQRLTPKTPIKQSIVCQNENETDLHPLSYVDAAKNASLILKRSSSLREMDKKEVAQFKQLSVYHESLVEHVVMSQDIMTPNSPM